MTSSNRGPLRIALIRHGESQATVTHVVGGPRGCTGLTDLGRSQVSSLAERLVATGELDPVRLVVTSALPRAIETGDMLAAALGAPTERDAAFNELEPGEADGLTWDEFDRRYPGFDPSVNPHQLTAPGGESWAGFAHRISAALAGLAARAPEGTTIVACHGGVVEQSMIHLLAMPGAHVGGRRLREVPNTSITEWAVTTGERGRLDWGLVRYADTAHLGGARGAAGWSPS